MPMSDDVACATPEEVCTRIDGKRPAVHVACYIKIVLSHSEFFTKRYGDRLSCGPHFLDNTILYICADDIAGRRDPDHRRQRAQGICSEV